MSSIAALSVGTCGKETLAPRASSNRIVFQTDRTGNFEVFSITPAGDSASNLTTSPGRDIHPAWSPDRTRIAYVSDSGLTIMNADASNRRTIFGDASYPSWSPDGRRIVFHRTSGLWTIQADGSGLGQLNAPVGASFPSWSADGQHIAFDLLFGGIAVIKADGTGLRQLVPPDSASYAGQPAWSPDGSMLAFQRVTAADTGSQPGGHGCAAPEVPAPPPSCCGRPRRSSSRSR